MSEVPINGQKWHLLASNHYPSREQIVVVPFLESGTDRERIKAPISSAASMPTDPLAKDTLL